MNDKAESQTLLRKRYVPQNQAYRGDGGSSSEDSCRSDGWWEGSASDSDSSCSSCCSDSGSEEGSTAEWEGEVDAHGNLFFIRSPPASELQKYSQPPPEKSLPDTPSKAPESQPTRKGKLAGLIRRRNSKRYRHKASVKAESQSQTRPKEEKLPSTAVPTSASQQGEISQTVENVCEVTLVADPATRHSLGRRATLAEALLGLVVAPAPDESRVKVVGFIPNGEAIRHHGIRVGDWLRCINGQEVTMQTLDPMLGALTSRTKLQLQLQRFPDENSAAAVTTTSGAQQVVAERELSDHALQLVCVAPSEELLAAVLRSGCGAVYLTQEGLAAVEDAEDRSLLYCFPEPASKNALAAVRGALLTLHMLLPEIAPSSPCSSTVVVGGQLVHVVYVPQGAELLLVALPSTYCPLQQCRQLVADVVEHLLFSFQTLSRAFTAAENRTDVDRFFTLFFSRLLSSSWSLGPRFEELLPAAHWVPLPAHAQLRLNSALSELESNNFEELGANIDECQRLFTIVGSCMYHKGYLLASHLPRSDLPDLHSFLRQQGLIPLLRTEPLRRLVIWREVFPLSCFRGLPHHMSSAPSHLAACPAPMGHWFLLVVGQEWDLLAVLLESAGCTVRVTSNPGPDICFVEEALDTLSYIQSSGISAIASRWVANQPRPQVTTPEAVILSKASSKDNFLGFMRTSESKGSPSSLASSSLLSVNSPSSKRQSDSASLTRRRGSSDRTHFEEDSKESTLYMNLPSLKMPTEVVGEMFGNFNPLHHGLQPGRSEDSVSQGCSSSVRSECSDEAVGALCGPVLGRRAERELRTSAGSRSSGGSGPHHPLRSDASDSDDSDWETYQAYSRRGYAGTGSSSEVSDTTLSWLADVDDILPYKLTAGEENTLFHYVQLDVNAGVLLAPPTGREGASGAVQLREVLACFRHSCTDIHSLLQNTVSFKKLMGPEVTKTISRSLVAIKEHGVLFELIQPSDGDSKKVSAPLTFWVVGRLFFNPHPKEVYVCYLDSAPQNMVEIAFRLGLSIAR